ncbi:hypothetical protein WMW72_26335 [Paenibacillus filicis]|uniref:Uncharacterized protein n=1 Tax=Paenibacillus filicis TaxID=669464 RepID=A0ABU9DRF0_9BACL
MLFLRSKKMIFSGLAAILLTSPFHTVEASAKQRPLLSGYSDFSYVDEYGQAWLMGERKPTKIKGFDHVVDISHGSDVYAVKDDGTVWTYLRDYKNENTWFFSIKEPIQIPGLSRIKKVATDISGFSAALDEEGRVWTWVYSQHEGRKREFKASVLQVPELYSIRDICVANRELVLLHDDGTVSLGSWPEETVTPAPWAGFGLGGPKTWIDPEGSDPYPIQVKKIKGFTNVWKLSNGNNFHVLKSDGTVWGWSEYGNLTSEERAALASGKWDKKPVEPFQIKGLTNVVEIGDFIALKDDGTVWQWGGLYSDNYLDVKPIDPSPVPGLKDAVSVYRGPFFSLVLKRDGTLWTWGGARSWGGSFNPDLQRHDPNQIVEVPTR